MTETDRSLIARRFRDFVNFSAYLDVRPNDDIVDILGFLSFEMVRSLCVTALDVRQRFERPAPTSLRPKGTRRMTQNQNQNQNQSSLHGSPKKGKGEVVVVVASPEATTPSTATIVSENRKHTTGVGTGSGSHYPISLFAPPPSARQPLLPCHVLEAFAQIQRQQASSRVRGMRNFRGGLNRSRVALV